MRSCFFRTPWGKYIGYDGGNRDSVLLARDNIADFLQRSREAITFEMRHPRVRKQARPGFIANKRALRRACLERVFYISSDIVTRFIFPSNGSTFAPSISRVVCPPRGWCHVLADNAIKSAMKRFLSFVQACLRLKHPHLIGNAFTRLFEMPMSFSR